jgi:exodeoxyribonuclease-3
MDCGPCWVSIFETMTFPYFYLLVTSPGKASFKRYMEQENPDLIAIQETKSNNKDGKGEIDLAEHVDSSYHQYWSHAQKPGYSGTLVLSRIPAKRVLTTMDITSTHSAHTTEQDGRVVALEFAKCWVVSLYVPNSAEKLVNLPYRRDWSVSLLSFVSKLDKPCFLMGDFNVAVFIVFVFPCRSIVHPPPFYLFSKAQ